MSPALVLLNQTCRAGELPANRIQDEHSPLDLVLAAEELRYAAQAIGKITGRIGVEDILDTIFKEFCIGK